jgi:hypothetical protein
MTAFVAADTGFETSVRESFSRMTLMTTIGARLVKVATGQVHIDMADRAAAGRRVSGLVVSSSRPAP